MQIRLLANGNVTSYTYSTIRRLTKTTFPDNTTENYTYKTDGLLDVLTDRKGTTFQSYYDAWKRLTANNSASGSRTYTFTGQKLTQGGYVFTGGSDTHTFTYDPAFRVATHAQGTRGTITYTYDANDRVATYSVSGGGPNTTYTYYADGSLRTIAWSPVANNFTYNYTLNGQYDLITFPNGQTRDYTYDDQGGLTQIANIHPTAGPLATYVYGYDLNNAGGGYTMKGQRTTMTASVPFQNFINSTTQYFYDNNYQLTKAIYPNVAPFSAEISEWTYDDIGNRTQSILNGTPTAYTYFKNGTNPNNGQRLQSDGVNTYTYDLNGNNTTRTGYTFTWYNRGELFGISGTPAIAYRSDFAGRRFRRTIGTTNYDYLYDGQNLIGQRTTGVQDFVFGPGIDEPLATKIGANIYYYSVDGLGSVALLTDTSGAVQDSYVYDVWGSTRSQSGSLANPFTYTSREANEAGMLYYRARYYNPNIGRFVSEDPLGQPDDGRSHYAYAGNDPAFYTDPTGWKETDPACVPYPNIDGITVCRKGKMEPVVCKCWDWCPDMGKCIHDHEEAHKTWNEGNLGSDYCQKHPDEPVRTVGNQHEQTECLAYQKSYDCATKKIMKNSGTCQLTIENYANCSQKFGKQHCNNATPRIVWPYADRHFQKPCDKNEP